MGSSPLCKVLPNERTEYECTEIAGPGSAEPGRRHRQLVLFKLRDLRLEEREELLNESAGTRQP